MSNNNVTEIPVANLHHVVLQGQALPEGIEIDFTQKKQKISLDALSTEFKQALLDTHVSKGVRERLVVSLGGSTIFDSPATLQSMNRCLVAAQQSPMLGIKVMGRRYPIAVEGCYMHDGFGGQTLQFDAHYCIGEHYIQLWKWFDSGSCQPDTGKPRPTVRQVLEESGIEVLSADDVRSYKEKMSRYDALEKQRGLVLDCTTNVLVPNKWLWSTHLDEARLGISDKPKQLVIEPEMEVDAQNSRWDNSPDEQVMRLPFVRCFSFDLKQYVYVEVDDVKQHDWDLEAKKRLVLPEKMHRVLNRVFDAQSVVGDMFRGRHGGMIIMANGPSGVGKTLTAEVFAETTKRPLYVLEMGELGTNLAQVEESLQRIFTRAARWNAVLLFDEADVFLAKRQETDLERSAIVGVFLRLLDRYEGTFFLTTNRADVIDPAFKSRITLALEYPQLTPAARKEVWGQMLAVAGIEPEGDMDSVAAEPLNGRQIRNQVRLLRVLHPDADKIPTAEIHDCMQYTQR